MNIYKYIKLEEKYIKILKKNKCDKDKLMFEQLKKYTILLGVFSARSDKEYLFQYRVNFITLINDIISKLSTIINCNIELLNYNNSDNVYDFIIKCLYNLDDLKFDKDKKDVIIKLFEESYKSYNDLLNDFSIFDYFLGSKNRKEYKLVKSIYK